MGRYSRADLTYILESLRLSIRYAPLELQLVWLVELITVMHAIDVCTGSTVYVTPRNALDGSSASSVVLEVWFSLVKYRNRFCHGGLAYSSERLARITERKLYVNDLAEMYGVTLNWNNTLL